MSPLVAACSKHFVAMWSRYSRSATRARQRFIVERCTGSIPTSVSTLAESLIEVGSISLAATSWKNASSLMTSNPSAAHADCSVSSSSRDCFDVIVAGLVDVAVPRSRTP